MFPAVGGKSFFPFFNVPVVDYGFWIELFPWNAVFVRGLK
jgi:hypothetical protein